MTNKHKIQRAFNRAAGTYDDHCHTQLQAGINLTHLMKSFNLPADNIMDLGCGTGRTTQILASRYRYTNFHATDISTSLLTKARQRLEHLNIKVYEMDFEEMTCNPFSFDVIYSNMALQWSSDLLNTLANIKKILRANGSLAFTLPLAGTFKELYQHYTVNQFLDVDTVNRYLSASGYVVSAQTSGTIIQTFPHGIQALKSIKNIGATYSRDRAHLGLRTPSYFRNINFDQLTYVIGYFIARRPA